MIRPSRCPESQTARLDVGRTSRRAMRAVLAASILAATSVLLAPVASAHGDEATMALVSSTGTGDTAVVTVSMTYDNDSEPVESATVTVAGDNGAGATLVPVPMTPGPAAGQFTATVEFPSPGTWNLRATSVTPSATVSFTHVVAGDPGVSVTTEPDAQASTTAGPGDPADDGAPLISPAPTEDDETSSSPWLWILGGIAVVVCVGLGVVFVRRGRDQGPID